MLRGHADSGDGLVRVSTTTTVTGTSGREGTAAGIDGRVAPGLEQVADLMTAFVQEGRETGASLVVVQDGLPVVDVQVGWSDLGRTRPFRRETLVHVYSVSKPIVALATLYALRVRGIDVDEPVCARWPEYGQAGKADTTVRHLVSQQAGLPAWPNGTTADIHDHEALTDALVVAAPRWRPGTGHGEHALTYGHLLDGYLRRATGVGLAKWLARLGRVVGIEDLLLGIGPDDDARTAELEAKVPEWSSSVTGPPGSMWHRSLSIPEGALDPDVLNSTAWRRGEFGAIGVHTTATALASLYADLLDARGLLAGAIGARLYRDLLTPGVTGVDEIFGLHASWGLGMPVEVDDSGRLTWFGMGGVGGSLAYANPVLGYGFGYVTRHLAEDDRAESLSEVINKALAKRAE